ncbi:MAG: hypothetical protein RBT57_00950 [Paludibacter sp.]|jgi:hypothetical protein|nr:hypothetical protein [Paludibacter sp.]
MKEFFLALLLFSGFTAVAQVSGSVTRKVPKEYSLEVGYRYVFHQTRIDNKASQGYGALFDYAWQLSGFDGTKAKSFISVPMGYTIMLPDDPSQKRITMLNYGWTVRHELKKQARWMPFVGYGLFLNTLRFEGIDGGVFGHQTQFDFGYNFNTSSRLQYFAKLQYSYTSYPQLNESERIKYHYADIRLGVRF